MNLNEIIQMQMEMDLSHGFPIQFSNNKNKYDQITKDLVGLFGEIGEFSNIVKKINIHLDHPQKYQLSVKDKEKELQQELVDCLIYVIRLGSILNIDLQTELIKKMKENSIRYEKLREK